MVIFYTAINFTVSQQFSLHTPFFKANVCFGIPLLRKNGEIRYADISSSRILLDGKEYLIGFFRDITERKRAEEFLKKREQELEIKTSNLDKVNTALRVLLKSRDEDREEFEDKVLFRTHLLSV